ncbi:hypothetical protein CK203_041205 [Vitis vinifera]|uniref:Uncharacterized protein n=2 Tax=Vitis vinifera TaxID=29760 RepID=A0A438HTC0_VITVI|nr:hypothetical protein CK203_041205 [Vitis vinifera]
MVTAGRATCIVFSDDDLPPDGLDHTRPLYISISCSGRQVTYVFLDNGSALNACPLAIAIALGYAPSNFGPSDSCPIGVSADWCPAGAPWMREKKSIPWRVRFTGVVPHAKDIAPPLTKPQPFKVIFNLGLPFSSSQEITNGCLLGVQKLTKCWQFQKILPQSHLPEARKGSILGFRQQKSDVKYLPMSVANIGMLQGPFRKRKWCLRDFADTQEGLRNHFATKGYSRRAAKLASILRFLASRLRHISGNFRRKYTILFKKAAKSLRNKRIVRAYDSTRREVIGTLEIELLIAGAIPSSLHQNLKFIHDGQISHNDDDLFLTGFTFDEVQTLEIEDFCRDFVAMSFDQHDSIVVLDMMRNMSYLPVMRLRQCQHGPSEFMAIPDHDVPFGLRFIPIKVDYRYMARLHKERVRARLTHTPFDYLIHPYTMSSADYFVRVLELQSHLDGIIRGLSTVQEAELQYRVSLMTLYFSDEVDEHGTFVEIGDIGDGVVPRDEYIDEMLAISMSQIDGIVQPKLASPFDLFGVFTIEVFEEIQIAPASEFSDDVILVDDLFDSPIGPVEGAFDFVDPPLSFDVIHAQLVSQLIRVQLVLLD